MSAEPRSEQLVQIYLDGALSPAETAELAALLVDDPQAADAFARATRFEALLQTHLVEERRAAQWSLAGETQVDEIGPPVRRPAGRLRRPIVVGALAAAALATAAIVLIALRWQPVEHHAPGLVHRVVTGRVLVDGVEAVTFLDGSHLEVLGSAGAAIHLADGNDFELAPATTAVVRDDGREAIVRLDQGNGKFRGGAGRKPMRVDTPLGAVSGRAADFAVDFQPTLDDAESEAAWAQTNLPAFLVVAVLAGQVEVEEADRKVKVSAGEKRAFAQEKIPVVAGKIVEISADGKHLTLEGKPAKPGLAPQRREVAISKETKLTYYGVAAGADRPTVGSFASAVLDKESPDSAVAIEFGQKTPTLSGTVREVSADGRRLKLEVFRKGESPLERTIALDDQTRTTYSGFEKQEPAATVGYQAWVWLAGDSDRAVEVRFLFKTKGPAVKSPMDGTKGPPVKKPPLGDKPTKPEKKPDLKTEPKPKPKFDAKTKDPNGPSNGPVKGSIK